MRFIPEPNALFIVATLSAELGQPLAIKAIETGWEGWNPRLTIVGLQIHEAPGISASAAGTLLAGSAVTVEPGVYLPDHGGVRIEDTLVIREKTLEPHGRLHETADLLTRFPKELAIL